MKRLAITTLFLAGILAGQTIPQPIPAPVAPPPLPAYVSIIGEFNQLATPQWALGLSAIYTTTGQNNIGMANSTSADIVPVKGAKDPVTGRTFTAISAQLRQGVSEKLLCTGPFCVYVGADIGPGFSSTPAGGVSISATGSFSVITRVRLNSWLSFVTPVRMLYVNGIGWNPVLQGGLSFNLHKLPPPK